MIEHQSTNNLFNKFNERVHLRQIGAHCKEPKSWHLLIPNH